MDFVGQLKLPEKEEGVCVCRWFLAGSNYSQTSFLGAVKIRCGANKTLIHMLHAANRVQLPLPTPHDHHVFEIIS